MEHTIDIFQQNQYVYKEENCRIMSLTYTNTFHGIEKKEKDRLADIQKPLCGIHRHSVLKKHYMFCAIWNICSLACTYDISIQ